MIHKIPYKMISIILVPLFLLCSNNCKYLFTQLMILSVTGRFEEDIELQPMQKVIDMVNSGKYSMKCRDATGMTPLHYAFHAKLVKTIIENSGAPNAKDKIGATPLHYAVKYRCPSVISELIKFGADLNIVDKKGMNPSSYLSYTLFNEQSMENLRMKQLGYFSKNDIANNVGRPNYIPEETIKRIYKDIETIIILKKYGATIDENYMRNLYKIYFGMNFDDAISFVSDSLSKINKEFLQTQSNSQTEYKENVSNDFKTNADDQLTPWYENIK